MFLLWSQLMQREYCLSHFFGSRYGDPKHANMEVSSGPLALLLRLVAVPAGAPGSSATGPGAITVRPPGAPLSMDRLQVQRFTHTNPMSAVL